ncbi:MAG: GyrI-like domain-containing protein [Parachlamydiales bacterium]
MERRKVEGFRVVGRSVRVEPVTAEQQIGALWVGLDRDPLLSTLMATHRLVGVYTEYAGDYTKPYTYFLGVELGREEEVPKGLARVDIPSGEYGAFPVQGPMPEAFIEEWARIWRADIPRLYKTDFERYGATEAVIYLSIKSRAEAK